ncbi:MAG TPA: RuBisCO large subunit C-terminal-like domain-containing protein [Holophaga sp.]|nr:RuBisCO large subunit C-terminal-like domain-containing protein [Holophaga sp.]
MTPLLLSGERFRVDYRVSGTEAEARAKAEAICVEQTVEFPRELLPAGPIPDEIVGRVEAFEPEDPAAFRIRISYAVECAGGDLVQLLNVVFGNISLMPGIRVVDLDLPEAVTRWFGGPRFGREGLRELCGVRRRPLLCSALKPMGLSARDLAAQAHAFALGGIDLIKDDHGLSDQPFCRYEDRVAACAEAVARANRITGGRTLYLPHVSGPADQVFARARRAKDAGAGGLLVCPALVGFDTMRCLAEDDSLALPVMAHPAFGGSLVSAPGNGFSHGALFGALTRLAGADLSVYPNFGGRFSFSREECVEIAEATRAPLGGLAPSFPAPGGGMTTDRARDLVEVYGRDFALLIGGGLHRRGPDLADNVRHFVGLLEAL